MSLTRSATLKGCQLLGMQVSVQTSMLGPRGSRNLYPVGKEVKVSTPGRVQGQALEGSGWSGRRLSAPDYSECCPGRTDGGLKKAEATHSHFLR
jgi:hypothetical protein